MATTVRQIIDEAYATSSRNRPGSIANEPVELLGVVQRALSGLFADALKFNRVFYARRHVVSFSPTQNGWLRPPGVYSVIRMEKPDGTEVVEVPFDQKSADLSRPAVYLVGRYFHPAGNPLDPVNGNLSLICSVFPATMAGLDSTLDPLWPEEFNGLLVMQVARYLAVKDGREGEAAAFREEWVAEQARYIDYLKEHTTTLVREYGSGGFVHTNPTVAA
jgi:hypothetical protein